MFTLRDVVQGCSPAAPPPLAPPRALVCPGTGKVIFDTKDAAKTAAHRINITERTNMSAFRCGFGPHFHLGHRRGAIY